MSFANGFNMNQNGIDNRMIGACSGLKDYQQIPERPIGASEK